VELLPAEITIHVVFLLGLAAVAFCARHRDRADPASRMKFIVYYLIVQLLTISTLNRTVFIALAGVIAAGGLIEILRLKMLPVPLVVFLTIAVGFMGFALKARMSTVRACFVIVAVFDFASEIGGRIWGRTRILPKISPGKTTEGLATGICVSLSVAAVPAVFAPYRVLHPLLFTALTVAAAFIGDGLASFCKRRNGIKDFSAMIPAHGGVLDRFDSFLMSAALLFAVVPAV
jgi:phosphatidate cytidylyltransferase